MLAKSFQPADQPGTHIWEFTLGLHLFPFLAEHSFQTHPVLPATVYCELMLAAATLADGMSTFPAMPPRLIDIRPGTPGRGS